MKGLHAATGSSQHHQRAQINIILLTKPTASEKMMSRVKLDLYYMQHWTFWLDIKIVRTDGSGRAFCRQLNAH